MLNSRALRLAGILVAFACISARADIVTLDNGKTLEGRVSDDGKTVTIEMAQGVVRISKSRVVAIEAKTTLPDEYAERSAELRKKTEVEHPPAEELAELWYKLALWAGEKRLPMARADALKKAIELNPDHAGARKENGQVFHDGRWMTISERNTSMGLVMLEGKWVPREAAEEAKRLKEERLQREHDEDTDRRLKEAEVEKLEAEKRLLDAKRDQIASGRDRPRYIYRAPIYNGFEYAGPDPVYGPTIIRRGPLAGPIIPYR